MGGTTVTGWVRWWDRLWGAVWVLGSLWVAYQTARWFALNASPADLGPLRYALVAFAFVFGLLVGMALLSLAIIGVTVGLERLFARLGFPLRRPDRPAGLPGVGDPPPHLAPPSVGHEASLGTDGSLAERR